MAVNREVQRLEDENRIEQRIEDLEQRTQSLERKSKAFDEACAIIQELARLIAGWEHLPAVPVDLQRRAEEFGADWSG